MTFSLFVWRAPDVFVVVRCPFCPADVRVRWPERWRECDQCGERTHANIRSAVA